MTSILETVPHSLQEHLENYEQLIPAVVPALLLNAGVSDADTVLHYVAGAIDHQERIRYEKAHVFKVRLDGVEYIERKSGDWVLGKKAEIHFTDERDNKSDVIMTDWVEYNSYNAYEQAFWVALSKTIAETAEANIGKEVLIRKAFKEAQTSNGGDKVRYAASLTVIGGQSESKSSGKSKSSGGASTKNSSSGGRSKKLPDAREITRTVKDDDSAYELYEDLSSSDHKKIVAAIIDAFDAGDNVDKAIDAFLDGVDTRWKPSNKTLDKIEDSLSEPDPIQTALILYVVAGEHLSA